MTSTDVSTGGITSTRDSQTGPAPTTAGPHRYDVLNKLDPRVDSDLNDRAQYAPGLTVSGNVHPGTTQTVSNPNSSNKGPHDSRLMNVLDPRVDSNTGNMTTKTTNRTNAGSARGPTDTSGTGAGAPETSSVAAGGYPGNSVAGAGGTQGYTSAGVGAGAGDGTGVPEAASSRSDFSQRHASTSGNTSTDTGPPKTYSTGAGIAEGTSRTSSPTAGAPQASSTGAAGAPTVDDPRNIYDPRTTGYNPATGSGYPTRGTPPDTPTGYSRGDSTGLNKPSEQQGQSANDYGKQDSGEESRTNEASERASSGVKGIASRIHGAGKAIRGGFMGTLDRIFGNSEGASRNEAIARQGEQEIKSGRSGSAGW